MIKPGLYEQVISKQLSSDIDETTQLIDKRAIDKAEAPQVLSSYLTEIIEKALARLSANDTGKQLELANRIVATITEMTDDEEFDGMCVDQRAEQLLAVANMQNNADALRNQITIFRPETSLSMSSLFTGAAHEQQMMRANKSATPDRFWSCRHTSSGDRDHGSVCRSCPRPLACSNQNSMQTQAGSICRSIRSASAVSSFDKNSLR